MRRVEPTGRRRRRRGASRAVLTAIALLIVASLAVIAALMPSALEALFQLGLGDRIAQLRNDPSSVPPPLERPFETATGDDEAGELADETPLDEVLVDLVRLPEPEPQPEPASPTP